MSPSIRVLLVRFLFLCDSRARVALAGIFLSFCVCALSREGEPWTLSWVHWRFGLVLSLAFAGGAAWRCRGCRSWTDSFALHCLLSTSFLPRAGGGTQNLSLYTVCSAIFLSFASATARVVGLGDDVTSFCLLAFFFRFRLRYRQRGRAGNIGRQCAGLPCMSSRSAGGFGVLASVDDVGMDRLLRLFSSSSDFFSLRHWGVAVSLRLHSPTGLLTLTHFVQPVGRRGITLGIWQH